MSRIWGCYSVNKSKFWNEKIFSFVPQRILEISFIFLTSLLADEFIKLEWVSDKLIRCVNPPIDSQVLLFYGMSEKSVILHEEITSSQADTVSVVGSARNHFAISINLHVPLKRNFLWRWAKRVREPGWSSGIACCWRSWWNWWRCGERAHIEGEGIDVVFSAPALLISEFELHGFIFSEIVRMKGLEKQTSSEGFIGTARPPQCEFSNLQTSLAFGLLE